MGTLSTKPMAATATASATISLSVGRRRRDLIREALPQVGDVKLVSAFVDPGYRRALPGRLVMTLGLFMSGCCAALIIVLQLGS